MSNIINPEVGNKVWYFHDENATFLQGEQPKVIKASQAMDATVVYVWNDRMVNLDVTDHVGNRFAINSVPLVQPSDVHLMGSYCKWPDSHERKQAAVDAIDEAQTSIQKLLDEMMGVSKDDESDEHEIALAEQLADTNEDYLSNIVEVDGEKFMVSVFRVRDITANASLAFTTQHLKAREEAGIDDGGVNEIDVGAMVAAAGCKKIGAEMSVCHGELNGEPYGTIIFNTSNPGPASLFEAARACVRMQGAPLHKAKL